MVEKRLLVGVIAVVALALLARSVFLTTNYVTPLAFLLAVGLAYLVWWLVETLELRGRNDA